MTEAPAKTSARELPAWAASYVGLPWKIQGRDRAGLDCWGLVRLVMAEQYGIELPSLAEDDRPADRHGAARIAQAVQDESARAWQEVPRGVEREGDVIVLRFFGRGMHVGLVLGGGLMLHIEDGVDSCIEQYQRLKWRDKIVKIYRHEQKTQ